MRMELKLDEVDRGRLVLGQKIRVSVDAMRICERSGDFGDSGASPGAKLLL